MLLFPVANPCVGARVARCLARCNFSYANDASETYLELGAAPSTEHGAAMTAIIHVRIISIAEFPRVYLTVTTISNARQALDSRRMRDDRGARKAPLGRRSNGTREH
jgi:hypothetical protein